MKAITIKQPFASLIAAGLKEYEFRTWKTAYRGEILIHAGKSIDKDAMKKFESLGLDYPTSCIIAKATLTDCIPVTESVKAELRHKNTLVYSGTTENPEWHGYGFRLENIEKVEPICVKGMLGLWECKPKQLLYHGSAVPGLTELQPLSKLHNSDQKVVYLSPSIPYVLLYIWDSEKTGYSQKWVTGWMKDGIAYYEEQFPGQLKAFYDGVAGYIYSVLPNDNTGTVQQRENMLYCSSPVPVHGVIKIDDVYQELLHYEEKGLFRVLRYEEASAEKQKELVDRIAQYINMNNLHEADTDHARFMMRYFTEAWRKTK